ncbi:FMR1 neighbor protein [Meriones unguiculatus]|uniref:FMR1 neighbor protein n=1 Tax=Meriones unguiculatus TaxID=10047 RepID=UPI00293E779E|nr:FMR1 neighbor protein [Meriones unguiculatus]
MPSDFRPRHGRYVPKNRAFRGGLSKMTTSNTWYRGENPALRMFQGRRWGNVATGPRFGFWATAQQYLKSMWARRYLALFLLLFWSPLILLYLVNTETVSAKVKVPWHGETVEQDSNWRSLLSFLFPTTCIIRDYQKVVACNNKSHISKGECLKSKCCFSSSGTIMRCYAPLRDKPAQMFRVFGFAVIGMIVLGFLPMYCYSFCRRRSPPTETEWV